MLKKYLERFVACLIATAFFVPLLVFPDSFIFPFIVPKILFFRSLVLLMFFSYVALLIVSWKEYKPRISVIHWAVLLFFFSFALSTFFGVDWYKSFWDNHERMLGLFTIAHYVLYYFVVSSLVKEWRDIQWLSRICLGVGGLVMLLGVWQRVVDTEFLLNRGSGRVASTLGNAIYYSGYGFFLLCFGALTCLKERVLAWKWYAAIPAFLGFVGIFLGGTRGTLFGLIVGIVVLAVYYAIGLREHPHIRKIIAASMGIIVCCGIGLFFFRNTSFVQNIPAVGRLLNTSFTETTASTRILAWNIAFEAWQDKPIIGWGPNNYFYAFNTFYRPEFLNYGFQETWFDNAHSALFNTFAVQGTLGGITYILLFLAPLYALYVGYRKQRIDIHMAAIGSAFLVGHFVHNAFVFENPTSYLFFFWFIALMSAWVKHADDSSSEQTTSRVVPAGLLSILGIIALFFIYTTDINPARANTRALQSVRSSYSLSPDVVSEYKSAVSVPSPHIDDIRSDFARAFVEQLPNYARANRIDDINELYTIAYADLIANKVLHPLDIRTHVLLSRLLQYGASLQQNSDVLIEANNVIDEAIALSPKRQQLVYLAVPIKRDLGKTDEAIQLLEQSIADDPTIGHGWWRLAALYHDLGQNENAKETLLRAEEQGVVFDSESKQIVEELKQSLGE